MSNECSALEESKCEEIEGLKVKDFEVKVCPLITLRPTLEEELELVFLYKAHSILPAKQFYKFATALTEDKSASETVRRFIRETIKLTLNEIQGKNYDKHRPFVPDFDSTISRLLQEKISHIVRELVDKILFEKFGF